MTPLSRSSPKVEASEFRRGLYGIVFAVTLTSYWAGFYIPTINLLAPVERFGWSHAARENIKVIETTRTAIRFSNAPDFWVDLADLPKTHAWLAFGHPLMGFFLAFIAALVLSAILRVADKCRGYRSLRKQSP
ncbi:hypothetical protein HYR69_11835 [Candidatus Sumerlaeota bacterium]|nr:hypothetical protein [Candidatus Sumerlaeota bacterium]